MFSVALLSQNTLLLRKTNPFYAISQNYAQFIDIGRIQRSELRESSHLLTLLPHIANIDDTPKNLAVKQEKPPGSQSIPCLCS